MSHFNNEQLLETVNETVDWASELGEQWAGTTLGRILDNERDNLLSVVKNNDLELASVEVINLAQTCMHAEEQLREMGEF